jgi:hypothetical protein
MIDGFMDRTLPISPRFGNPRPREAGERFPKHLEGTDGRWNDDGNPGRSSLADDQVTIEPGSDRPRRPRVMRAGCRWLRSPP